MLLSEGGISLHGLRAVTVSAFVGVLGLPSCVTEEGTDATRWEEYSRAERDRLGRVYI